MAAVISSGVKTTGAVVGGVQAAEETGPARGGAPAAEVAGSVVAVEIGVDMTDPETADTRLIGSAILPGLGRRL